MHESQTRYHRLRMNINYAFLFVFIPFFTTAKDFDFLSLSLEQLSTIEIATGTSVAINKAPAIATLINEDDIKAMGAVTIVEVLESVPGLHVIPSTLNRTLPSFTFRGIYSGHNPQVLFMLNGYAIYSSAYNSGPLFLSELNISNIDRIEVVRGPGSAIYGADAYSGVINIITKTAKAINKGSVGIKAGTHNTQNAWFRYGTALSPDWDISLSFEHYRRDADKSRIAEADLQTTFDNIFATNASLAPTYIKDNTENTTYSIHLDNTHWHVGFDGYLRNNAGVGAGAAQAIDHEGFDDFTSHLFTLAYQSDQIFDHWRFESQFSYFYTRSEATFTLLPPGSVVPVGNDGNIFTPHDGVGCQTVNIPGIGCVTTFTDGLHGNPGNNTYVPKFNVVAHYSGWNNHQIRLDVGIKKERFTAFETKNFGPGVLDSETLDGRNNPIFVDGTLTDVTNTPAVYIADKSRLLKYASLQDIWRINADFTLTSGIRFDHYDDFGNTVNPRLALVWNTSQNLITKLLYGEAYRAPSFSDLYVKNNPVTLGNENLSPEEIKTTELSFNYTFSPQLNANLNLYYFKTKNMIETVTDIDGVGTAQNNKNLTGQGFELEAHWQPTRQFRLSANFAKQSTKNDNHNQQVEYVPQDQLYLDARYNLDANWRISAQLNWVMNRERAQNDLRQPIDDYAKVNLTLRRLGFGSNNSNNNWAFSVAIKNLFDSKIYEPTDGKITNDYLMHGRRIYAEASYRF